MRPPRSVSLTRKRGMALWLQVKTALAAEIEGGAWRPGERLPTEPELMERFGVSRFTVRQAIASLERRGLVRAEQGRGTFVHRDLLAYPISSRTRFSRNLIEQGFDPGGELLLQEVIPASEEVAEALAIAPGALVAHRRGIGTADGIPIEVASVWLPADRFPDFARVKAEHATYTATFAAYGIPDYLRLWTRVEGRLPTPEEAEALRQLEASPVLAVTRLDADLQGRPISYGRSAWSGERVVFDLQDGSRALVG
nr:phosphonate metabolism transcriptional regulator PhnF [Plastoroseomonas hellenica]